MPKRLVSPALIARSLLIALLAMAARPTHANATEKAVMKVFLNTMEMGDYFLMVSDGGVILMKPEDLLDMGFKKIPEGAGIRVGDEDTSRSRPLGRSLSTRQMRPHLRCG